MNILSLPFPIISVPLQRQNKSGDVFLLATTDGIEWRLTARVRDDLQSIEKAIRCMNVKRECLGARSGGHFEMWVYDVSGENCTLSKRVWLDTALTVTWQNLSGCVSVKSFP